MACSTESPVSSADLVFHPFILPEPSTANMGTAAVSIRRTISFVTTRNSSTLCILSSTNGTFTIILDSSTISSCKDPLNISCNEWMASISTSSQGRLRRLTTSRKALNDDLGCIFLPSSLSPGSCFAPPHLISFAVWDRNQNRKSFEVILTAAIPQTSSPRTEAAG
ncbi:hypothetical protein ACJW31_06G080200 [Castanea mollissima]